MPLMFLWQRQFNSYFYNLQFLQKILSCEKSDEDKSSAQKLNKTNKLCDLFPNIFRHCQDFLRKLPKLVTIHYACMF